MRSRNLVADDSIAFLMALMASCSQSVAVVSPKKCASHRAQSYGIVGGSGASDELLQSKSSVALARTLQVGVNGTNGSLRKIFCTGVVVAPNLVLTAAHCLWKEKENFELVFSESVGNETPAERIRISSEFLANPLFTDRAVNDIGWVKFSGGLPGGFSPARVLENTSILEKGKAVSLVGYGLTGTAMTSSSGSRRMVETVVDTIVDGSSFPSGNFFNLVRLVDTTGAARGACYGDSGGPAFVQAASTIRSTKVLGVTQGVIPGLNQFSAGSVCESGDVNYTLIAPYLSWLQSSSGVNVAPQPLSPRVTLKGVPEQVSGDSSLDITVEGEGEVFAYRFALGNVEEQSEPSCSDALLQYSELRELDTKLSLNIANPGKKILCVIGRNIDDVDSEPAKLIWEYAIDAPLSQDSGEKNSESQNARSRCVP